MFQVALKRVDLALNPDFVLLLIQVNPDYFFIAENSIHGEVLKSREAVRYWDCKKISDYEYQVIPGRYQKESDQVLTGRSSISYI